MLAESGDAPSTEPECKYEPKLDGYRVLAFIDREGVVLRSRRGLDYSGLFPGIAAELGRQLVSTMVLDGEIVAFGPDGSPSFEALQSRTQMKTAREIAAAEQATPTAYVCFDLLHFAGVNLRPAAYEARRRYLAQCLLPSARVQLVHADDDANALYNAALASGFEDHGEAARQSYLPGSARATGSRSTQARVRGRRLHEEGRACAGRVAARGLGSEGAASIRRPRRLRPRRGDADDDQAARRAPEDDEVPLHRAATAERSGDLARARAGRRSEVRRLDGGRQSPCAGLPAATRRRRSEGDRVR
jgi:hypothetical protein